MTGQSDESRHTPYPNGGSPGIGGRIQGGSGVARRVAEPMTGGLDENTQCGCEGCRPTRSSAPVLSPWRVRCV